MNKLPLAVATVKSRVLKAFAYAVTLFGWTEEDERDCIDLQEAIRLYHQGAVFVDVRKPFEWKGGSIHRALHATAGNLSEVSPVPDKSDVVVTYCEAGDRARRAARHLQKMGFRKVYFLWPGGYSAWVSAGYPVTKLGV